MTTELHRPIRLDQIGRDGLEVTVEASRAECAALAERMRLPGIGRLVCRFHLRREVRDTIVAEGHLRAEVTQTCVVSLEDFDSEVEEAFRVRFVPAGQEDEEIDPDADDEIPYEDSVLDLGEAAAEQLALALDPYPRMPGAELPEMEEDAETNPFAALRALRSRH